MVPRKCKDLRMRRVKEDEPESIGIDCAFDDIVTVGCRVLGISSEWLSSGLKAYAGQVYCTHQQLEIV